jgi:hypothetical protein
LCLIHYRLRHEDVWGSGCIDPRVLNFSTSWRWVFSFMSLPLYQWERAPGTHWIGGWVGPRADVDDMNKWKFLTLPRLELWPLGRPTLRQSLYWLSYRGSCVPAMYTIAQLSSLAGDWLAVHFPDVDFWAMTAQVMALTVRELVLTATDHP